MCDTIKSLNRCHVEEKNTERNAWNKYRNVSLCPDFDAIDCKGNILLLLKTTNHEL